MGSTGTVLSRNANVANLNPSIMEETLFSAGNEENADFVMDISRENTTAILNELTDLSSNPGAYAIREAYSNAYDAVMATGDMSRPIEVDIPDEGSFDEKSLAYKLRISECPSEYVRYATVTDHGIGMSAEDLRKFFTQYGGTKKQGQGLIGSKGLGSKAPLACADFFDVVTCKDGIRSYAHLWRGNGHNYAKIVRTEKTSDGNGTTIRIPVVDPKIAAEMRECMDGIAKWNLDATLVYNGKLRKSFLTEGLSRSGEGSYVFLGNVQLGVDEDGNEVRMRMWQSLKSFPEKLHQYTRWYSTNAKEWSMSVDLNLCGVRYALAEHGSGGADIVVAGDPGYLNFTPSRDEVKDDDAKQRFLEAIARTEYDATSVLASILGECPFPEAYAAMLEKCGCIEVAANGTQTLIIDRQSIGTIDATEMMRFDGIDMSDYLAYPSGHTKTVPASDTRYRTVVRLAGKGYVLPSPACVEYDAETGGFRRDRTAYELPLPNRAFPNKEIENMVPLGEAMPLAAVLPSPAASGGRYGTNGSWAVGSVREGLIAKGGSFALVVTDGCPDWGRFQRAETGIRRIAAAQTGLAIKDQPLTYLFLEAGDAPTEQDLLALGMFAHVKICKWDDLMDEVRVANRKAAAPRSKKSKTKIGKADFVVYDLSARVSNRSRSHNPQSAAYDGIMDALFGPATDPQDRFATIDLDADDLSDYVFCIGDGGNPEVVVRAATAAHLSGKMKQGRLVFVSNTASSLTNYPLTVNEVNALVKARGIAVFADLRAKNGARRRGLVDEIDGIELNLKWSVPSSARVSLNVDLGALGVKELTDNEMALVVRNDDISNITNFAREIIDVIGTTTNDALDRILGTHNATWWYVPSYYGYRRGRGQRMGIILPEASMELGDSIERNLAAIKDISEIAGIRNLVSDAKDRTLAAEIVRPGLLAALKKALA